MRKFQKNARFSRKHSVFTLCGEKGRVIRNKGFKDGFRGSLEDRKIFNKFIITIKNKILQFKKFSKPKIFRKFVQKHEYTHEFSNLPRLR